MNIKKLVIILVACATLSSLQTQADVGRGIVGGAIAGTAIGGLAGGGRGAGIGLGVGAATGAIMGAAAENRSSIGYDDDYVVYYDNYDNRPYDYGYDAYGNPIWDDGYVYMY